MVDAGHVADRLAAVGEGYRDLVAAQVVGIGQDLPLGNHDSGAALVTADSDDGRPGLGRRGLDGALQIFDETHSVGSSFLSLSWRSDL